jgi:papain like protease
MKHSSVRTFSILFIFLSFLLVLTNCKKSATTTTTTTTTKHGTGWTGSDNPSKVPQAVNIAGLTGSTTLPSKVDLTPFLPPVGDQGQTETCVAWATAYYAKTASEAIANNYSQNQLSSQSYQLSPLDMFLAIPDNEKGADCKAGTNISYAFDILVANGVATMAAAPWDAPVTNCSQSLLQPAWATDAANHKAAYYRTIPASVEGIKEQLAANNPVVIGIQVSDEYQSWTGTGVLSTFNSAPLGGHAQCIVGYDDSKGSGGAFRIINSWNTSWGDNGFIWIDYNTLVNKYIDDGNAYYMASSNTNTNVTPTNPPTTTTSPVDIAPWVFSDASSYGNATDDPTNDPTARKMWLNIYNIGQNSVDPSVDGGAGWSYYYIYYNAFNANDYGIIFHDEFNTSIAANTYSCPNNNACTFNISIPAGSDFAQVAFNTPEIYRNYFVPNTLNGYYYLVLVADPQNVLNDVNQQNNIFYTTGQLPAAFVNGVTSSYNPGAIHDSSKNTLEVNPTNLHRSKFNSSVSEINRNAYTPQEILGFVKAKYLSGEIRQKVNAMSHSTQKRLPQIH